MDSGKTNEPTFLDNIPTTTILPLIALLNNHIPTLNFFYLNQRWDLWGMALLYAVYKEIGVKATKIGDGFDNAKENSQMLGYGGGVVVIMLSFLQMYVNMDITHLHQSLISGVTMGITAKIAGLVASRTRTTYQAGNHPN